MSISLGASTGIPARPFTGLDGGIGGKTTSSRSLPDVVSPSRVCQSILSCSLACLTCQQMPAADCDEKQPAPTISSTSASKYLQKPMRGDVFTHEKTFIHLFHVSQSQPLHLRYFHVHLPQSRSIPELSIYSMCKADLNHSSPPLLGVLRISTVSSLTVRQSVRQSSVFVDPTIDQRRTWFLPPTLSKDSEVRASWIDTSAHFASCLLPL